MWNRLNRLWREVEDALLARRVEDRARQAAEATAPVIWMLGKTQAGKTAIVAALTGDSRAEIGQGFAPCTRESRLYDVPSEAPVVRFLDTRGLGEARYDPAEDIAFCEAQAHLLLAVMQASDPDQGAVLRVVREARRRHPEWPLVVAQTGLHRLYPPGVTHAETWDEAAAPEALRRALEVQRRLFDGLGARFVPLDFTEEEAGLSPRLYRVEALREALETASAEVAVALRRIDTDEGQDRLVRQARRTVYAYAALAGGAGAVPVPLAGLGGLATLQALMLRALAERFGVTWTRRDWAEFIGSLGTGSLLGVALRYGLAEAFKLLPGLGTVLAGAANAAAAAALTTALGEAAIAYLSRRRLGEAASARELREVFAATLRGAWAR
ncbi:GTPase domain-containing protein [Roseococcus sp. MDT2-1-1]|uniref:GTPase domain-containing protein n=1 Tax=Sabulicella glaciei TaxID=2984948 RepID=A0ABT3P0P5_9PROT|nr:GTPase domain-containing protein [Roseococcus sp. MDT2-1-1]